MRIHQLTLAIMVVLLATTPARAATGGDTSAAEIEGASAPDSYVDPAMEVENAFSRFFAEGFGRALNERMAAGELYVGQAWAEVQVPPSNSQWAKYRVLAYETALTEAENDYLLALSARIKTEKLRRYFADNSGAVPDFDESDMRDRNQAGRIIGKLFAAAEGKLDQTLNELGIDPAQYNAAPEPQRRKLFSDALTKRTLKEATGTLAGLVPIQTFEAQNSAGEHVIGLVVVASSKMREFAHDIASKRGQLSPDPERAGDPVYRKLSEDAALLVDQFGIRQLYDESGYPVLVSYGQWGNAYLGENKRQARRQRDAAQEQARMLADQQIAMFVAGRGMVAEESTVGQMIDEFVDVHQDNYKEQQEVARIVDELRKRSEARANVTLSGLSDLFTWTRAHPSYPDREIVGVVRLWSPRNEQNMRALKDWKPAPEPAAAAAVVERSGENALRKGKGYMRADDF